MFGWKKFRGVGERDKKFYSWDKGNAEVQTRVPRKIKEDGDYLSDTSPKAPAKNHHPLP